MDKLSKDIKSIIDWYLWKGNIIDVNKEYHHETVWNSHNHYTYFVNSRFMFNYREFTEILYHEGICNIKHKPRFTGFYVPKNY